MARKIIQIAVSVTSSPGCGDYGTMTEHDETLYALTDDGLVFYSMGNSPTILRGWRPLVAIPQGVVEIPLPYAERMAAMSAENGGDDE